MQHASLIRKYWTEAPHCRLMPTLQRTPANICIDLTCILPGTRVSLSYILSPIVYVPLLPAFTTTSHSIDKQESRAVTRKPRDAAAVLFGLKFTDNIHCKFKSSQASKARLQSSKHTGAKQNLTQNGHLRSFKVTCFGVSLKAIKD